MTTQIAAAMATSSPKEADLMGNVLRRYPQADPVLRRHFGQKFLGEVFT
jgi:hypothetical protein